MPHRQKSIDAKDVALAVLLLPITDRDLPLFIRQILLRTKAIAPAPTDFQQLYLWLDDARRNPQISYVGDLLTERLTKPLRRSYERARKKEGGNPALSMVELRLSVRTVNCLEDAGIQSVPDLLCLTEDDLLKIRNFGRKCLREVKEELKRRNLRLAKKVKD